MQVTKSTVAATAWLLSLAVGAKLRVQVSVAAAPSVIHLAYYVAIVFAVVTDKVTSPPLTVNINNERAITISNLFIF